MRIQAMTTFSERVVIAFCRGLEERLGQEQECFLTQAEGERTMVRKQTTIRKQTLADYVYWALNYPAPRPNQPGEYIYYYPISSGQFMSQDFQYVPILSL